MKKILLLLALIVATQVIHAQTFDEWFKQKKTQIEYLLKQIAALKTYTDYLEKGYHIVQQGSQVISDIKHGDFDLHNNYFNSLKSINPAIKNYSRIAVIISDQAAIIKTFKKLLSGSQSSNQFTSSELNYINGVYLSMANECGKVIEELLSLITSGDYEMKDDERIRRIDDIYYDMQDKYSFAQSFSKQTSLLAVQRFMEQTEVNRSRKLFGF
jgi:hypothetical protein